MKSGAGRMIVALGATIAVGMSSGAWATPSTQIWIPSPDTQQFGTFHLNYDTYTRPGRVPILMLGPTAGVLPFEKIKAEVGFDLIFQGNGDLDAYPLYFHAKLATPEDALFKYSPSIAVGGYNFGVKPGLTTQNIGYGLVGRTLPVVGRFAAGYYFGNELLLLDVSGDEANHGVMLSWDRTMSEITDKLWLAVDYQGGQSMLGALNFGASWLFAENVSLLVGFDHYLNQGVAGKDTFTVQVDINF